MRPDKLALFSSAFAVGGVLLGGRIGVQHALHLGSEIVGGGEGRCGQEAEEYR